MPKEMIFPLVFGGILIIAGIVLSVISLKNVKQHISHNVDGYLVEIIIQFTFVKLVIDGKVVDELHSYQMRTAKLQGQINGKQIIVNIGSSIVTKKRKKEAKIIMHLLLGLQLAKMSSPRKSQRTFFYRRLEPGS